MALFKIALVALAVAAASASGLRDSVHAALSTAVKPGRIAKQLKCTEDEATSSTSKDNCAACGCVACPCCISGGKGCPRTPIWKETEAVPKSLVNAKCSEMDYVSNQPNDPISCAVDAMPALKEACAYTLKADCQKVIGNNGNLCVWYNLYNDTRNEGVCAYNPCSDVNDGSCTIKKTGGRCVWYGNPQKLLTIKRDGKWVKEIPNPFSDNAGCYMSPCNNPVISTARECELANVPHGVPDKVTGDYSDAQYAAPSYQCQWCYNKPLADRPTLGCQNTLLDSVARPASISPLQNYEGKAPCGNYFCNFYEFEASESKTRTFPSKRTNSGDVFDVPETPGVPYPLPCKKDCKADSQYTWKGAFGTGTKDTTCKCPFNWGVGGGAGGDLETFCPGTRGSEIQEGALDAN